VMQPDGTFVRAKPHAHKKPLNSQLWFLKHDA
jgi:hypothetical protein